MEATSLSDEVLVMKPRRYLVGRLRHDLQDVFPLWRLSVVDKKDPLDI